MSVLQEQIQALSRDEFTEFYLWLVNTEEPRRQALPKVEAGQAELMEELRKQGVVAAPAAEDAVVEDKPVEEYPQWVNPGADHSKMYTPGMVVRHEGELWESTMPGLNPYEPGLPTTWAAWRKATPASEAADSPVEGGGDTPDDGVQPWAPGQTVAPGDERSYNGVTYVVVQGHTTQAGWEPNVVPALWKVKEN